MDPECAVLRSGCAAAHVLADTREVPATQSPALPDPRQRHFQFQIANPKSWLYIREKYALGWSFLGAGDGDRTRISSLEELAEHFSLAGHS